MNKYINEILFFTGILMMFFPAISGMTNLVTYFIPGGLLVSTIGLLIVMPEKHEESDILDSFMSDEQEPEALKSDKEKPSKNE